MLAKTKLKIKSHNYLDAHGTKPKQNPTQLTYKMESLPFHLTFVRVPRIIAKMVSQ